MKAPALLGPVITTVIFLTVLALFGPHEALLGGPFMNWLITLVVFVPLALLQGACILGFGALFRARTNPPAMGRGEQSSPAPRAIAARCAWIAALLTPLPVAACWFVARPASHAGGAFVVALFAPIVIAAGLVRVGAALTCHGCGA